MSERPEYIVNQLSHIDDNLVQPGERVFYDGLPGSNLEPVNEAAERMKAKARRREVVEAKADDAKIKAELDAAVERAVVAEGRTRELQDQLDAAEDKVRDLEAELAEVREALITSEDQRRAAVAALNEAQAAAEKPTPAKGRGKAADTDLD